MAIKLGINGFGRIGRDVVRIIFERDVKELDLVAINATGDMETFAHLFKYDTAYGRFKGEVEPYEEGLIINGKKVKFTNQRNPEEIPWKELGVELVIDSTGAFRNKEGLEKHLKAGAKKVILTAPAKGEGVKQIVMGVNEKEYDPKTMDLISNASCTTNCLAPVTKVMLENFGIENSFMTTVHAYTNDQKIQDSKHKDLRRARAAAVNIVPTTTGAAKAVGEVIPAVKGKMTGYAVRVPVITGSLIDVTFELSKEASVEDINAAFKKAAESEELKGRLGYTDDPIVSSDIIGSDISSLYDAGLTVVNGTMAKVVAWYDNEWGYSMRVVDLAKYIGERI